MSNFIITAKGSYDVNDGHGARHRGTPKTQTEAATELIINRLYLIDRLQQNRVSKHDTIVTLPERKFLYENIFDRVIDYQSQFVGRTSSENDLVARFNHVVDSQNRICKPFYKHYERDKDLISCIKYNDEILNKQLNDFIIVVVRLKNSDTRRNLDLEYWREFLTSIKDRYDKIFIFGKGCDELVRDNIEYIDTLQDYCSYLHHEKCKHVISTISGPCHYVQQFGNVCGDTTLHMIDNNHLIPFGGHDDPSYFHPCINFTKVHINIIDGAPEASKLQEHIWKNPQK
jgi:hypothetical protein